MPILAFPAFDPVIVQLGPFAIRWYALAYIVGLVAGWRLLRSLVQQRPAVATGLQADDFLTWAVLGVILGGRLGYVLFYQPLHYLRAPWEALAVWQGGMSFHGGCLGVTLSIILFCWRNRIPVLGFADRVAPGVPIGLGLGRLANFVNGELWGRSAPESLPWAMVFPYGGSIPRHPSQIYEALLEGVALFCLLFALSRRERLRARFGFLTGAFLTGYGFARIFGEFFREPDVFKGFLFGGVTMGQLLSAPMVLIGMGMMWRSRPAQVEVGEPAKI